MWPLFLSIFCSTLRSKLLRQSRLRPFLKQLRLLLPAFRPGTPARTYHEGTRTYDVCIHLYTVYTFVLQARCWCPLQSSQMICLGRSAGRKSNVYSCATCLGLEASVWSLVEQHSTLPARLLPKPGSTRQLRPNIACCSIDGSLNLVHGKQIDVEVISLSRKRWISSSEISLDIYI